MFFLIDVTEILVLLGYMIDRNRGYINYKDFL